MNKQQVGTIVGSNVHLTGSIKDSSDITIFGSVEGEVHSEEKVIIEESAHVKGPIGAKEVIVSGAINGTVTAREKLELNSGGSIKGNIDASELLIHAGATFIGKCNMPDKKDGEEKNSSEEEFQAEIEKAEPETEAEETEKEKEEED